MMTDYNEAIDFKEIKMEERLFWMDRNYEGLEEIGYLLTASQLEKETDLKVSDFDNLKDKETELDGAYWGNDTYIVTELHTLGEVEKSLTWNGFEFEEGDATSDLDSEEYPEYIPKELRLSRCVWRATGYTDLYLPSSRDENPTIDKYVNILGLNKDNLKYHYTNLELIAIDLSQAVYEGYINEDVYLDTLNNHKTNHDGYDEGVDKYIENIKKYMVENEGKLEEREEER